MRAPRHRMLAARVELLQRVLAHRLEHREAQLVRRRVDLAGSGSCRPATTSRRAPTGRDPGGDCTPPRRPRACRSRRRRRGGGTGASRRRSSSSWLQSIAWRSVCCRTGRSGPPPVSRASRRSRRPSICAGERMRIRAAASSMASGRPSRRAQISAIVGGVVGGQRERRLPRGGLPDEERHGRIARQRVERRQPRRGPAPAAAAPGCTARRTTCRTARLVTSSVSAGRRLDQVDEQRRRREQLLEVVEDQQRPLADGGADVGRAARRRPSRVRCATARAPAPASAPTSAASASEPRLTNDTPPGKSAAASAATCSASRVLPLPPGPASVSTRLPPVAQARRGSRPLRPRARSASCAGPAAARRRAARGPVTRRPHPVRSGHAPAGGGAPPARRGSAAGSCRSARGWRCRPGSPRRRRTCSSLDRRRRAWTRTMVSARGSKPSPRPKTSTPMAYSFSESARPASVSSTT